MNPRASDSASSRRQFLKTAAGVAWVAGSSPRAVRAAVSPNSRIHVGLIGCGGMGRANLNECARHPDVVVSAACDVWKSRREAVVAQFPDTCRPYADFREMLQAKALDAVIIATPPHWHALQAIAACEAGKDFYLQKPMSLHLGECLAIRNAVRKHGRISQVGTQIHAGENYRRVVEWVRSGGLGKIGVVRTFNVMNQGPDGVGRAASGPAPEGLDWEGWCGPAPRRPFHPLLAQDSYHHCSWMDYSGGWTPGMAPHILDLPVWAMDLGYPLSISASGGRFVVQDDGDAYDHHDVLWRYPGVTLTWMSSLTNSYDFRMTAQEAGRRLGIYFHGSNGTLFSDYGSHRIFGEGGRMEGRQVPVRSIPPSPGHEREWLDAIRTRREPSCRVGEHVKVDVPIVLSLLSLKLGRSIQFDPVGERIVGDAEAVRMSVPTYRAPWRFPTEYLPG